MAEQRKVASGAVHATADAPLDDATGKGKGRRRGCSWHGWRAFLFRRGQDILGIVSLWAWVSVGVFQGFRMMEPADSVLVCIVRPTFEMFIVTFTLSWMGVIYHGPGRLPPEISAEELEAPLESGAGSRLAPMLVEVLNIGRLCKERPFSGEEAWCERSRRWKHPLVHHCGKCGQCSVWMDHHCGLCGQCIGFRNLRCFMVWLTHATGLFWCLIFLTVHCLYHQGWPQSRWWLCWLPWLWYVLITGRTIGGHLISLVLQACGGWNSRVMRKKFTQLRDDAERLQEKLAALLQGLPAHNPSHAALKGAMHDVHDALQSLRSGTKMPTEGGGKELIWGPFLGGGLEPLSTVFGAPMSWRWILPLVPGGGGDPFSPDFSEPGCKAWLALGAAMQKAAEVYAPILAAQREQQQRVEAMLAAAAARKP